MFGTMIIGSRGGNASKENLARIYDVSDPYRGPVVVAEFPKRTNKTCSTCRNQRPMQDIGFDITTTRAGAAMATMFLSPTTSANARSARQVAFDQCKT